MDEAIYWLQQPADFRGWGDYVLYGMVIALLCIVILIAIFGKGDQE